MIKKICFAAIAAAAVISCSEKNVELPQSEGNEELVTFSVSIPGLETKSVGDVDEKKVNSLQVIVFNKYGVYESSAYGTGTSLSLTCTAGQKRMVALVNTNTEENLANYEELSDRHVYLKDMGPNDLVMLGDTLVTVAAKKPINLDVRHLSSKITLESVRLKFTNQQHKKLSFAVKAVYLTNVAGDRKYISSSTPATWYHENAYDKNNTTPFIYDFIEGGHALADGETYDTDHYFYCYPNSTATKTRLVIEAEIGGNTYYYPIVLDEVLPNNQYSYNVILTRLGIDSPDGSLDKSVYTVNVTMKDWKNNSTEVTI